MPPEPPLPPFGTPPPAYGYVPPYPAPSGPPQPDTSGRTVDRALSWLLFAVQVLGAGVMVIVSIFAVFIDAYCNEGSTESCANDNAGDLLIGYWIALVVLLVATLIALIVATSTKRQLWPWAVGGFGLSAVATVVFFAALAG